MRNEGIKALGNYFFNQLQQYRQTRDRLININTVLFTGVKDRTGTRNFKRSGKMPCLKDKVKVGASREGISEITFKI